jgi:hypothetical protein
MINPKLTAEKLSKLLQAWKDLAPEKKFGGMTYDEFTAAVQPSFDARIKVATIEVQLVNALTERSDSDIESQRLVQLVVNSIKGDPTVGDDSALYEAAGYVRRSERKSGLRRQSKRTAQPLATAA